RDLERLPPQLRGLALVSQAELCYGGQVIKDPRSGKARQRASRCRALDRLKDTLVIAEVAVGFRPTRLFVCSSVGNRCEHVPVASSFRKTPEQAQHPDPSGVEVQVVRLDL